MDQLSNGDGLGDGRHWLKDGGHGLEMARIVPAQAWRWAWDRQGDGLGDEIYAGLQREFEKEIGERRLFQFISVLSPSGIHR